MEYMLSNCSSLKELDLSSFNANKDSIIVDMFYKIKKSCKLKCKDKKILKEYKKSKGCIII